MMIDIFQYSNMYTVKPAIQKMSRDDSVSEECGLYVTRPGKWGFMQRLLLLILPQTTNVLHGLCCSSSTRLFDRESRSTNGQSTMPKPSKASISDGSLHSESSRDSSDAFIDGRSWRSLYCLLPSALQGPRRIQQWIRRSVGFRG
jgi:hypothetical protein